MQVQRVSPSGSLPNERTFSVSSRSIQLIKGQSNHSGTVNSITCAWPYTLQTADTTDGESTWVLRQYRWLCMTWDLQREPCWMRGGCTEGQLGSLVSVPAPQRTGSAVQRSIRHLPVDQLRAGGLVCADYDGFDLMPCISALPALS